MKEKKYPPQNSPKINLTSKRDAPQPQWFGLGSSISYKSAACTLDTQTGL